MLRSAIALLFLCLLTFLPPSQVYAAPVLQQSTEASTTTYRGVVNSTANIRSGPGTTFSVENQARAGQVVTVVGCNNDCSWFLLDTGNWIAAFLVDLVDESSNSGTSRPGSALLESDELVISDASPAALAIVEQILSYTGLPLSFRVQSANIYNAAALIVEGERVILYDPKLIEDIERVTGNRWIATSILAHEIGHHLAGHTLAAEYTQRFELEADYFSGFVLYKMGATLAESQGVMNLLRDHPNMDEDNHPPQAQRLAAIEDGWQIAAGQISVSALPPALYDFKAQTPLSIEADNFKLSYGVETNCTPQVDFQVGYIYKAVHAERVSHTLCHAQPSSE
jgi:hypothetical protein